MHHRVKGMEKIGKSVNRQIRPVPDDAVNFFCLCNKFHLIFVL